MDVIFAIICYVECTWLHKVSTANTNHQKLPNINTNHQSHFYPPERSTEQMTKITRLAYNCAHLRLNHKKTNCSRKEIEL